MPPKLALALSIFFILVLLFIDFKQKPAVSFALWVPLIWFALTASRSVYFWLNLKALDLGKVNYIEGNPIDRTVYTILIIIGVFILLRRKVDWRQILRSNSWIFVLFFYMGLSVFWSNFRAVAFKRWIRSIGTFVMVLLVLTESNPLEAISTLLRRCFYIHLPLSIVLIKYFRTIGVAWDYLGNSEMWVGVTTHKNILGQVAMVSGIYFIWNILNKYGKKRIFIDILFILMTFWLLKGADNNSKTSIFAFFLGVIMLFWLHLKKSNLQSIKRYLLASTLIIVFIVLIFQFGIETFIQRSLLSVIVDASGRDMTFTGRTELWNDVVAIASHHPILGVGYGSFWIGNLAHNLWEKYNWKPGQAHSGYIDVYVQLGLIGLFLITGLIFVIYKNIMNTFESNFEYGSFRIVLLSMILLSNITESVFLRGDHNLWFLFLLVAVNIPNISRLLNQ